MKTVSYVYIFNKSRNTFRNVLHLFHGGNIRIPERIILRGLSQQRKILPPFLREFRLSTAKIYDISRDASSNFRRASVSSREPESPSVLLNSISKFSFQISSTSICFRLKHCYTLLFSVRDVLEAVKVLSASRHVLKCLFTATPG